MKLKPNQLVMWRTMHDGWKLFRVTDVRPDKVYMISRHGHPKNFNPARYSHRIRTFGLAMLIPWLHPRPVSETQFVPSDPRPPIDTSPIDFLQKPRETV